jgi:hypothetical protein
MEEILFFILTNLTELESLVKSEGLEKDSENQDNMHCRSFLPFWNLISCSPFWKGIGNTRTGEPGAVEYAPQGRFLHAP